MDELDKTIQVFGRDLVKMSPSPADKSCMMRLYAQQRITYSFVLLIKIVYVAVENFDKQFNGHGSIHACICYAKSALQTLKHPFRITVQLWVNVSIVPRIENG